MTDTGAKIDSGEEAYVKYLRELQPRKEEETRRLLQTAKSRLPKLKNLLEEVSGHWGHEDPIYRFYHQSFKVYHVQAQTQRIVEELQALAPHLKLNPRFERIVLEGTGMDFDPSHNQEWERHTRPMVEAFCHARHFLEMICKYAEQLDEPPQPMPSGWATMLYLFDLR